MAARLHWSDESLGFSATSTEVGVSNTRIFLVAEAVSDGTWDWAAWSRRGRHSSLHGHADTLETAMRKAELAAGAIGRTLMAEAA